MPQRPVMTRDEVSAFIDREFPQIHYDGRLYHIEEVGPLFARLLREQLVPRRCAGRLRSVAAGPRRPGRVRGIGTMGAVRR